MCNMTKKTYTLLALPKDWRARGGACLYLIADERTHPSLSGFLLVSLALSRLTNQQRTVLRLQILFFFWNVFFRMVASMGICFCTHCGPHLRSAWVCIDSETVTRCSWESLHLSDMSSALHLITLYSNKQISFSYWHIQIQNWINTKCKDTQSNPKENTLIRLCWSIRHENNTEPS